MKEFSEKGENSSMKKKGHHGVTFEQCGRNLIEAINTSDNGVNSLDFEQSQHVKDELVALEEWLSLLTPLQALLE
jgi:hypothetical protein